MMIIDRINEHKNTLTSVLTFVVAILLIWILYKVVQSIFVNWSSVSSPGNILSIQKQQENILETRWSGLMQKKQGLDSQINSIPQDQQLLINTRVFSTRLTGFAGPYKSGVFDEDASTRIALSTGSRCLVLEIDYEHRNYSPKLIYRDGWGMKQSLNSGSIAKVAKSIASRAFTPSNDGVPPSVASDPLIVVLYFVRTPNQGSQPHEYMKFLGAVAEQLKPLRGHILGQTPQGDYRRQALESQIFFTNYKAFQNKIILMTNADTSGFRRLQSLGLAGELGMGQDLDFLVNVRMYGRESPSQFGITGSPSSSIKPAAVITSPGYWKSTPSDRVAGAVELTKEAWTLCMESISSSTNQPDQAGIDRLYNTYGVHSVPTTIFSDSVNTDIFTGVGKIFATSSWSVKPELIRFIPPKAIPVQHPYPQANSGGGKVISPKL
jgi:hypothetical protein